MKTTLLSATTLLTTALLLISTGCAEEEGGNTLPASTRSIESITDFGESYASALCDINLRCNLGMLPTDASCPPFVQDYWPYFPSSTTLTSGATTLDTTQAQTCLDAIDTLTCDDAWHLVYDDIGIVQKTCPLAVPGTAKLNEPCYSQWDCEPGYLCDNCPGTCQGRPCGPTDAFGEVTDVITVCAIQTEYCDEADGYTCKPAGDVGDTCSDWDIPCMPGLHCVDGVCDPGGDIGDPCDPMSGVLCREGLQCLDGGDGTCTAQIYGQTLGEPCNGISLLCGNGLFCERSSDEDSDGTCATAAKLGESCADRSCTQGTFCQDDICSAPPEDAPRRDECPRP